MVIFENLKKTFGNHSILNRTSGHIHQGETVAILGKSGCGKSTLLRCLNFLDPIDSGTIIIDGQSLTSQTISSLRSKMCMVFQNPNLFPHLSVLDNLIYAPVRVLK